MPEDLGEEEDVNSGFLTALEDSLDQCLREEEETKIVEVLSSRVLVLDVQEDVLEVPCEREDDEEEEDVVVVDDEEPDKTSSVEDSTGNIFLQSYYNPPPRLCFPFKRELEQDKKRIVEEGEGRLGAEMIDEPAAPLDDDLHEKENHGDDAESSTCDAATETSEELFGGSDSSSSLSHSPPQNQNCEDQEDSCSRLLRQGMERLYLSDLEEEEEEETVADSRPATNCSVASEVTEGGENCEKFYGESRLDRERRRKRERKRRKRRGKRKKGQIGSDGESEDEEEDEEDAASYCSSSSLEMSSSHAVSRLLLKRPARTQSTESASSTSSSTTSSEDVHFGAKLPLLRSSSSKRPRFQLACF